MSRTTSGFKYEIDERIKKDWDFLKAVTHLQEKPSEVGIDDIENLATMLLGEKGFQDLRDHVISKNDGFCLVDEMTKEITEIIKGDDSVKK